MCLSQRARHVGNVLVHLSRGDDIELAVGEGQVGRVARPERDVIGCLPPPATEIMASLGSMPVTEPEAPTADAISQARKPGPEPMSRTRSPGCSDSAPTTMRRCSTTSGVV